MLAAAYAAWVGPLLLPAADTWWHLLQVQRCMNDDTWLPADLTGAVRLHAGVWHGVLGQLCRATGWHPLEAWAFAGPWVAAGWVLAFGWCARRLLGPGRDVAGALAGLLLMNGTFINPLRELAYPRYVNLIHLTLAVGVASDYLERGRLRSLALIAYLGFAMCAVHLQEIVLFGMGLGFALPALFFARRETFATEGRRVIAAGLVALAGAAPYFALVVVPRMLREADALSSAVPLAQRLRDTLSFGGGWMALDPTGEFGGIAGGAGAAAFLLAPLWWHRVATRAGLALLFGGLMLPPLLVLTPWTFALFSRVWPVPDVVHRIALAMLVPWAFVMTADELRARVAASAGPRRVLALLATLALGASAAPATWMRVRDALSPAWRSELAPANALAPLVPLLSTPDARTGRVISDPYTTYHLVGITGVPPAEFGSSRDVNYDRQPFAAVYRFLRDDTQASADVRALLTKQRIRWVVRNALVLPPSFELDVHRAPYLGVDWMARNPHAFAVRYAAHGLTLYEVLNPLPATFAGKDRSTGEARAAAVARPEPRAVSRGRDGTFELVEAPHAPRVGRAGTVLSLPVRLRFTAPTPAWFRVRVHVLAQEAAGIPLGKLGRKVVETWRRVVYRFGTDAEIVPEPLQVLELRAGDEVARDVPLSVPATAAPGVYRVSVEIVRKPADELRRVALSDLPLPGLDAGEITVTAP